MGMSLVQICESCGVDTNIFFIVINI